MSASCLFTGGLISYGIDTSDLLVIDRILRDDKLRPKKQQHTAKRVFERLRDEYGFTGGITIVKDYVAGWRQRTQEMFVPLVHPPGHTQVDFGEAIGIIGGVERKIPYGQKIKAVGKMGSCPIPA